MKINKGFLKGLLKAMLAAAIGYLTGNAAPLI